METPEAWKQRVQHEQHMMARLRLAMTRLADAERERIWAMVAAKEAGLSIRQIARATGLSPTRVHQLLQGDEAREIPVWLSQFLPLLLPCQCSSGRARSAVPRAQSTDRRGRGPALVYRVAGAFRAADHVVVNLRPASEEETEFVPFDRPRVLRVLARIAADLDALARSSYAATEEVRDGQPERRTGIVSDSRSPSRRRDG